MTKATVYYDGKVLWLSFVELYKSFIYNRIKKF